MGKFQDVNINFGAIATDVKNIDISTCVREGTAWIIFIANLSLTTFCSGSKLYTQLKHVVFHFDIFELLIRTR